MKLTREKLWEERRKLHNLFTVKGKLLCYMKMCNFINIVYHFSFSSFMNYVNWNEFILFGFISLEVHKVPWTDSWVYLTIIVESSLLTAHWWSSLNSHKRSLVSVIKIINREKIWFFIWSLFNNIDKALIATIRLRFESQNETEAKWKSFSCVISISSLAFMCNYNRISFIFRFFFSSR